MNITDGKGETVDLHSPSFESLAEDVGQDRMRRSVDDSWKAK